MATQAIPVSGQIMGGGKAVGRVLRQAPLDNPANWRRRLRRQRRYRPRLLPNDRRERLHGRSAVERPLVRYHLVEDCPERKLIGTKIHGSGGRLLGGHVAYGTQNRSRLSQCGLGRRVRTSLADLLQLSQPEVQDLDATVFR